MTKGKWIVVILIILLLIFNGVRYFSSYQQKQKIQEQTISHLEDVGYETSEIYKTEVVNVGGNDLQYATVITFEDEKSANYLYTCNESTDQIVQIDAVDKENDGDLKHLE